jgi:hypothetical protein
MQGRWSCTIDLLNRAGNLDNGSSRCSIRCACRYSPANCRRCRAGQGEEPFFVLLEDDALVTRLSVRTDHLLTPGVRLEGGPCYQCDDPARFSVQRNRTKQRRKRNRLSRRLGALYDTVSLWYRSDKPIFSAMRHRENMRIRPGLVSRSRSTSGWKTQAVIIEVRHEKGLQVATATVSLPLRAQDCQQGRPQTVGASAASQRARSDWEPLRAFIFRLEACSVGRPFHHCGSHEMPVARSCGIARQWFKKALNRGVILYKEHPSKGLPEPQPPAGNNTTQP